MRTNQFRASRRFAIVFDFYCCWRCNAIIKRQHEHNNNRYNNYNNNNSNDNNTRQRRVNSQIIIAIPADILSEIFLFSFLLAIAVVVGVRCARACKYIYNWYAHIHIYILWRNLCLMRSSDNYYTSRRSSNKNNTYNNNNNDHKHNNCLINLSVLRLTVEFRSLQVLQFGMCLCGMQLLHEYVYICTYVICCWGNIGAAINCAKNATCNECIFYDEWMCEWCAEWVIKKYLHICMKDTINLFH